MKKKKSVVVFIIFLAIVAALSYYSVGILRGTMHKNRSEGVKLGLDLAGGVSITYQVDKGQKVSDEDMDDTVYKLQRRVEGYSTEAQAYKVGNDRITVEIPGVSNANEILEDLGTPGSLSFQTEDGKTFMTGSDVTDAQGTSYQDQQTGQTEYVVELTLSKSAAKTFAKVTQENLGKTLPIVYDGQIISQPTVQSVISDGSAQITGMSSLEEAQELASQIRIGSLKVQLHELQSQVVGAQLGSAAISTSIKAAFIGVILVMVFMIAVYWIPGLAASIALMIYTGIILAILHLYDVTLTLPGIAGIILSIGMAVDANVIIFARIREETAAGRTVEQAIKTGFKKAQSAILDSNITTLIAAAVLGLRGSGSVKGFAATLAIGVVVSMFTALFVTRWILKSLYGMGLKDVKFYGKKKERKPVKFVKKRLLFWIVPVAVIVVGIGSMGYNSSKGNRAFNFSLEFMGGTSTTVAFDKDYTIEQIDDEIVPYIEKITKDANVQSNKVQNSKSVTFKTRTLNLKERTAFTETMQKHFNVKEKDINYQNISSTVSSEMRNDAVWAIVIATICMLIYIWIRFRDPRFASAAVIALVHDVAILIAFYAISRTTVGTTFIACMLTIIGYSINSTIIIFDRIREQLRERTLRTRGDVAYMTDDSITKTLARTANTNITSLITLVALAILGVSSIREFSVPLIVGIIAGVYSSVLLTGPLWYTFRVFLGKYRKIYKPTMELSVKPKTAADGAADGSADTDGASEEKEQAEPGKTSKETYTGKSKKKKKKRNKMSPEDKTVV